MFDTNDDGLLSVSEVHRQICEKVFTLFVRHNNLVVGANKFMTQKFKYFGLNEYEYLT